MTGGLSLLALGAILVSLRLYRPSRRMPWLALFVALGLFVVAGVARSIANPVGNLTGSRPLLTDLVSFVGYLLVAFVLLSFSRTTVGDRLSQLSILLDGLIAAMAFAALAWVFLIQPICLSIGTPLSVQFVLVLYPAMSTLYVVMTLRIVLARGQERVTAYRMLLAAMVAAFVADTAYMFAELGQISVSPQFLDLPYVLAFVCAGAAALHPSMVRLTEPAREPLTITPRVRIALVAVALVTPTLLTLQETNSTSTTRLVLFVLMLAMTLAAVLRIVQALRVAERSEASMVYQAHHDLLTGLPNRVMMERHLSELLAGQSEDRHVAVLYLDLDRFKLINDTFGHSHGDELLVEVARRLRASVRPSDFVTRIGGDKFMVVMNAGRGVTQALDLAERLRVAIAEPFSVRGMTFHVSASIGVALAEGDDSAITAEVLVRDADTAMYRAKDGAYGAVAVFDETMRARVTERVRIERYLRQAVAEGQLYLAFQPIIGLGDGRPVGMEALVRWSHPVLGVVAPATFIPYAEDSGLITEIGGWVLDEALGRCASWISACPDMADLYISVNLSAVQLHDAQLADRVAGALAKHGLSGASLCLEITETVMMEDYATAAATIVRLRDLGVRVAVDDFGREYSALAYIKRFPVTDLKIDKSFISTLDVPESSDAALVGAIVGMARALGLTAVAEGVETDTQAERLLELGCDKAQGYLYSGPVDEEQLPRVIAALNGRATRRLSV